MMLLSNGTAQWCCGNKADAAMTTPRGHVRSSGAAAIRRHRSLLRGWVHVSQCVDFRASEQSKPGNRGNKIEWTGEKREGIKSKHVCMFQLEQLYNVLSMNRPWCPLLCTFCGRDGMKWSRSKNTSCHLKWNIYQCGLFHRDLEVLRKKTQQDNEFQ